MLIEENIPKFFYIISQCIAIDVNDVFSATHNNVFQKNDINFGGIENEYFRKMLDDELNKL